MKTNHPLKACGVGLCALALTLSTFANNSVDNRAISASLSKVPALELGSKAAEIVKQAAAKEMEATTRAVVLAAVKINPAATLSVVGAISKQVTTAAPVAAATAASKLPKLAAEIAKAAAAAAPSQAVQIVQAICKELPSQYRVVAVAAAQAVPSASKEIFDSLPTAVSVAKSGTTSGFEPMISGPTQGPPFVPKPAGGTEITTTNNSNLPHNGRNYSGP
jgi:hypothetical protein